MNCWYNFTFEIGVDIAMPNLVYGPNYRRDATKIGWYFPPSNQYTTIQ